MKRKKYQNCRGKVEFLQMIVLFRKPKYINPVTLFYKHNIKLRDGRKKLFKE